jgi:hypothetical protein
LISVILQCADGDAQAPENGWKTAISGDQKGQFLSVLPIDFG